MLALIVGTFAVSFTRAVFNLLKFLDEHTHLPILKLHHLIDIVNFTCEPL